MAVDGTTRDGMFKDVFGELEDTVPKWTLMKRDFKFKERARVGEQYVIGVRMRRGHGMTFASGSTSMTAFALNGVKSGQTTDANVAGSTIVGEEAFAYKAVASALEKGKTAFVDTFKDGVEDLWTSTNFYQEALIRYGQVGWGTFAEAGTSSTTDTVALTAASSAPGLWSQMEGAYVDIYDTVAFGTKRNSNAVMEVTGITWDPSTQQVSLNLSGNATDMAAIAAGDIVVPRGSYNSGHMVKAGIDKILTTTSGSIFGINTATYPAWAGTSYPFGSSAASFAKLIQAATSIGVRSPQKDEALKAYISPMTWVDLNNNAAALRRYADSQKGSVDLGTKKITYYSNVGTMLEIESDFMCKGGEGWMGFPSAVERGGASEPTFNLNKGTGQNERFLYEMASNAGFGIRSFCDDFVLIKIPKCWIKLTGIVNTL